MAAYEHYYAASGVALGSPDRSMRIVGTFSASQSTLTILSPALEITLLRTSPLSIT
jgi:hypothetical protein